MTTTEAPAVPSPPSKGKKKSWFPVALVALAIAIALGLTFARSLLAASYKVPSGSMFPTINPGEHVLVNRLDRSVAAGKIVVFSDPEHHGDGSYAKRIVAMPGDTVDVKAGEVFVNGKALPRCHVGPASLPDEGREHKGELFVEALGSARYLVFIDESGTVLEGSGPWKVAPGEVFVVGDNRNNSHDSRSWFGNGGGLPLSAITGTVRPEGKIGLPKGAEGLKQALSSCVDALGR